METSKNKVLRASLRLPRPPLEEEIFVPLDIILYLAGYLKFEDYRNFIKSFWPANDECDIIQNKLWQMSTHKIAVTFLNGKRLEIEYNFDASRGKPEHIRFNLETFLPIFGCKFPPGTDKFLSAPRLQNLIRMHAHLNMCSGRKYAACLCHRLACSIYTGAGVPIVKPPEIACKYGHFHHYCSQHVTNWLNFYLTPNVLLREMPSLFDEDMSDSLLLFISSTVHLNRR